MDDLVELYCNVDDFWKDFSAEWKERLLGSVTPSRGPQSRMSMPEMMTIVILFHQSNYRNFKYFYQHVKQHLYKEFPHILSYTHFVRLKQRLFLPLLAYLQSRRGKMTGISFIDSTSIKVCHNKRIPRNRVFRGVARRGRTTAGWFYGFKLHLVVNEQGEILACSLSPGNTSDVSMVEPLTKQVFGKLFGDKGYISSELGKRLLNRGLHLFTTLRSNMKQRLMTLGDKILLRKRSLIETINDQLKNISQIEHTRHRSPRNFLVNLLGGLVAYTHRQKKPSLNLGIENALLLAS